jgi:mono/diheme cytochrome c family protein
MTRRGTGFAALLAALALAGHAAEAAPPAQYIGWTRTAVAAPAGSPIGYVQFQNSCAVCHAPGPAHPGTRALAYKYHGQAPGPLEERTNLAPDLVKYVVRHGVSVMPMFRKTELSDADLDAIVVYLTRKQH